MVDSPDVHQFSEVPVDRDQNSSLGCGAFEQRPITRIGFELACVEDVVSLGTQPFRQAAARTVVDEELHGLVTEMADSVSSAITACA